MWLTSDCFIDVIKQNESGVGQSPYLIFWLIVYIICKATFYNRPNWNWPIGSKDTGNWKVAKTTWYEDIIHFVWLYLKLSICAVRLIFVSPERSSERDYVITDSVHSRGV